MCTEKTLFLVGCVKDKKKPPPEKMPAQSRYISHRFKSMLKLLDLTKILYQENWRILTHEKNKGYYVLKPDDPIEYYDIEDKKLDPAWFESVFNESTPYFESDEWEKVIVLTSQSAWHPKTWKNFCNHFNRNSIEVKRLKNFSNSAEYLWWPKQQCEAIQKDNNNGCFWCKCSDLE